MVSTVWRTTSYSTYVYKIPINKCSEANKNNSAREQKTASFYNISKFTEKELYKGW